MSSNHLDVEDATLHLVIQVQLEDLQGLKRTMAKGKRREGETPDSRVAIETYELELWRQAQVISDRSLCKRIIRANGVDGQVINALVAQEDQARRDMERDLRVLGAPPAPRYIDLSPRSSVDDLPPYPSDKAKPEAEDNPDSAGLPEVYISADADDQDYDDFDDILDQPESSAWAASRVNKPPAAKPAVRELLRSESLIERLLPDDLTVEDLLFDVRSVEECLVAKPLLDQLQAYELLFDEPPPAQAVNTKEKIEESTKLSSCPCSHEYCTECLRSLFTAAIADESLFPAKCCGKPISADDDDDDRHFLTPKLMSEFHAKEVEFSTPNRTYCHKPACSTFVPKESIKHDVTTCPKCNEKTCVMCKGASHGVAEDCKQDEATKLLLELAAKNHWQRCYSCGRVVELEQGCFHMLCRCRAEFCYLCGRKWKSCTCARWEEARLYARS
ncbi:IBR finger domain-containing protein [Colletotrichum sojae]|uniref:RBR-type E3 ubiquitin transferase n=1 Tax=Colletotrichum sojae TaxID=2175907 RepID=A0A8H6J9Y0_9PEZI|nr:IBR finger domain-containing protein [Colletotrichum sojae]